MGAAEVISFEEVRARKQWDALRGQLHTRFDQWLDALVGLVEGDHIGDGFMVRRGVWHGHWDSYCS